MATLATQIVSLAGLTPTFVAAAGGGDNFVPDVDTVLHVKNGGGAPITVTIGTPHTDVGGAAIADVVVSVPASSEKEIGPFPAEEFADQAGTPKGNAFVTYSAVTSVTVAVKQYPRPSAGS